MNLNVDQKALESLTLNTANAFTAKIIGPRRFGPKVKGPNLTSPSSGKFEAEGRAHKAQPACHDEGLALYSLVLTQMHLLISLSKASSAFASLQHMGPLLTTSEKLV